MEAPTLHRDTRRLSEMEVQERDMMYTQAESTELVIQGFQIMLVPQMDTRQSVSFSQFYALSLLSDTAVAPYGMGQNSDYDLAMNPDPPGGSSDLKRGNTATSSYTAGTDHYF